MLIRWETPEDIGAIREINKEAFGQDSEVEIVDKLRKRGVLALSLAAVEDDVIVGNIAFSPVDIESASSRFRAVALGPMAVLPAYQRRGIGSALIRAGLEECRRLGYEIVVLVGHSDYYPRFGFVSGRARGIECEFDVPDEAWMVMELREGALAGRQGTVIFQPEFREAI